jgi:hypothetical protein
VESLDKRELIITLVGFEEGRRLLSRGRREKLLPVEGGLKL